MVIQNKGYYLLATAFCMAVVSTPSHAWGGSASGSRGGSASWGGGSGSASTARGGSASWGGGSGSASSARGGSASWSGGSGSATGAYGGSASWSHSYGAYHPPAYGYHPPVYYGGGGYSSGDVAAAGVAGLAVGAMAGAAAASQSAPPPTTVVVQQPMAPAPLTLGMSLTYLPGNCVNINMSSGQYYECGPNWFKPYFGSNGVYYQVVPAPY